MNYMPMSIELNVDNSPAIPQLSYRLVQREVESVDCFWKSEKQNKMQNCVEKQLTRLNRQHERCRPEQCDDLSARLPEQSNERKVAYDRGFQPMARVPFVTL